MRRYGRERYNPVTTMMEEEDECDNDNEVDMPPIPPRVVNADEIGRIITQDYLADGLPEEFIKERLCWDRMSRPLLDGGEGEPKPATVQLKTHCHSIAAGQGPRVPVPQTGVTSRSPQRVQLGKSSSSKGFESPAATTVEREYCPRVPVPQTGVESRSPQRVQLGKSSSSKGFESPAATAVERESSWIGTPAVQTMNPLCGSPGERQAKQHGQIGTPAVQTMNPLCGSPGEEDFPSCTRWTRSKGACTPTRSNKPLPSACTARKVFLVKGV